MCKTGESHPTSDGKSGPCVDAREVGKDEFALK